MLEELLSLVDEVKRLRREGVETVYIGDDTLDLLRAAADHLAPSQELIAAEAIAEIEVPVATVVTPPEKPAPLPPVALPSPPVFIVPEGDKSQRWNWLRQRVLDCPECKSHVHPGKQVVFGVGNLDARIFFCGEAPGAEEEDQGEPFVGPAGELLNRIIKAMGLRREEVYIGNIMNWRPELPGMMGNRPPTREEMAFCLPYLKAQLDVVRPEVIVALGKTAIDGLLGPDPKRKMMTTHGHWAVYNGIPLMPTFHPSYLLRSNTNATKRLVWEDLMKVMERLELPISDKQRGYFL